MKTIEDHINALNAADNPQDMFNSFSKIMGQYGYDQVSYGCATDCPSLGLKKRHGHISNFDMSWLKHYAENNLSEVDPVHVYAVTKRTPAFWTKCEEGASAESIQLMRNASDVGLKNGIIIPHCDMGNEVSMVSLASSTKKMDEKYETLAEVTLLSGFFYQGYKNFIKKHKRVELNQREHEILTWAAEGKTDAEIALIVNISTPTVRYHWNNIFKKLDAYNKIYAVAKAVQMQLVSPYRIQNG